MTGGVRGQVSTVATVDVLNGAGGIGQNLLRNVLVTKSFSDSSDEIILSLLVKVGEIYWRLGL